MKETRKHIGKLKKGLTKHGPLKVIEYEWRKTHPLARVGFGILTAATLASIGYAYTISEYQQSESKVNESYQEFNENSQPDQFRNYQSELEEFLNP